MKSSVRIGDHRVGEGHPTYIIAEMSANHGGDFDRAVEIVRAAGEAGADAVKLQTYTADTMTIESDAPDFRIEGTLWEGRTLYDLYDEAHTPWEWHPALKEVAEEVGIDLFSSPFDVTAVEFLEELRVPAYKIASFENVDLPLLRRVAATGKPVILSTGMATLAEIDEAVRTLREAGAREVVLLKCTSAYPAPPESMNLNGIPHLGSTFGVPIGLSDHSMELAVPAAAVALGASVIEKHLIVSREHGGPDADFSLEPDEFADMVRSVRVVERALGDIRFGGDDAESPTRAFRRSLYVVKDVREGERFTSENVRSIRPGHGLHTRFLDDVLGRRAAQDVSRGTPLSHDLVAE